MLYYKRLTIEKSFNNSKSDFNERKAWSSNLNALNSQMRFTAMAYNIMRVFEETSKANSSECIHPSDKKYNEALNKRQKIAQQNDRVSGNYNMASLAQLIKENSSDFVSIS